MNTSFENDFLENITFDELTLGRTATITRTLTKDDIALFATVSGDVNPAHLDMDYARENMFHGIIGHGMWTGGLISMVLGTIMPGAGTIYLSQDLKFKRPVRLGDSVSVKVTVASRREDKKIVSFDCLCTNQNNETVVEGQATVIAPTERIRRHRPELPDVKVYTNDHYHKLMEECRGLAPTKTAVVHPTRAHMLADVAEAANEGLIEPILVGPRAEIEAAAREINLDISGWQFVEAEHAQAAAVIAAQLALAGRVESIMKGSIHTNQLLRVLSSSAAGLRTDRLMSHVYFMDVPGYHKPIIITDGMVNIAPDLDAKADICQNAVDFWRVLDRTGAMPKVAVLAAVETVNKKMPATIDAPALCKMVERGQLHDCIIDGPLTFDNAVDKESAMERGIVSPVVGNADILLAPDIESGNLIAKQLTFLGHAEAAGVVLGARVPIILIRRADKVRTRLASCAMASLLVDAKKKLGRE